MALSDARHKFLLEQLARVGRLSVAEMAAHTQVSHETIRRDLRVLERGGHLRCVYGGAVAQPQDALQDQPIVERMRLHRQEKVQIGRLAASLVHSGASIFLDTGTTTLALAQQLAHVRDVTVTTNSLDIARLLAGAGMDHVGVTGGDVRCSDNALVGHGTIGAVRAHLFDMAFMGIAAIDIEHGYMDYGAEESVLRQTLLTHARRCVMLADSSKFGRTARLRTFGLGEVGLLISDIRPPATFAKRFQELTVEVMYGRPAH
jgi:DeoR family glycerol-3-phosphate regulon repressor